MVNYAIIENGVVLLGSAINIESIPHVDYILTDDMSLPTTPPETWDYVNGVFTINQDKITEFNRQNMPTLTPIEFDIKLVDAGLYDQVQGLIQSDVKLKIAYTRATFFSRTDPFIDQARIALGLTDEQVDTIWESPLV